MDNPTKLEIFAAEIWKLQQKTEILDRLSYLNFTFSAEIKQMRVIHTLISHIQLL